MPPPPSSLLLVVAGAVAAVAVAALLLPAAADAAAAFRCDRRPKDVAGDPQPVNGRFRLEFSGKDNTYVPDHTYRVRLFGARHGPTNKNTFRVFTLFLEPESFWREGGAHHVGNLSTGGDSLVTFGECANSVRQTSGRLKDAVEVLWRAPAAGSGCVFFRATVVEDASKWYMDDEYLSLSVCEEERMVYNRQPEVQDPCCACDEAKYEMTFEGLWSRHSHPKDFPKSWDTRFSDVIGASHAANYSFWQYLQAASPGLRLVAENGTTRTLEKELKDNSQHIRTIIKARGIGWPNVTGKTFAVFRVDRDHHLMSIVSHIDPSPDWFVGISGLELCLKNCSWIENVKFDLYPWDAGTNDGITYYSKGQETRNELIRQITSSFPNSKDSPFFDPTSAEMKPIARIYLTRQRLYEKFSCDSHDNKNLDCATKVVSTRPCSVTCGRGVRLQQRVYLDPKKANDAFCNETLTRRLPCNKPPCPLPWASEEELSDPKCETTEWSDWTPCPVCGGVQTRDRDYKHKEYFKYCSSLNGHPILQETMPCDADGNISGCTTETPEPPESVPNHCELTQWSDWSPCSVTCGNGTRIRSRLLVARNLSTQQIDIMNHHRDEGWEPIDENSNDEFAALASASDCSEYKFSQEMQCSNIHEDCDIKPDEAKQICQLGKDEGPCRVQSEHWYFDIEAGRCKPFNYGGCRGNRNNFATQELCEEVCNSVTEDTDTTRNGFGSFTSFSLTQVSTDDASEEATIVPERERSDEEKPVNCRVSRWGPWSACSVTCGEGYKYKFRKIEVQPSNNGKACPKLRKKHKCHKSPCDDDFANQMQSDENPTWGEAHRIKSFPGIDCVLSAWSPWSSCTKSCGSDRRRLRTRDILVHPTPGGMPCNRRIEYTYCAPIPCISTHPTD